MPCARVADGRRAAGSGRTARAGAQLEISRCGISAKSWNEHALTAFRLTRLRSFSSAASFAWATPNDPLRVPVFDVGGSRCDSVNIEVECLARRVVVDKRAPSAAAHSWRDRRPPKKPSSLGLLESLGGSRRAASPVQRAIRLVELVGPGRRGVAASIVGRVAFRRHASLSRVGVTGEAHSHSNAIAPSRADPLVPPKTAI
jgi:hypothetical protein